MQLVFTGNWQLTTGNSKGMHMPSEALGLLECKGLVSLMEGTDAMLKSANVEMIGWDKAGSGMVTAFVKGDVAAVKTAGGAGAGAAGPGGAPLSPSLLPRPPHEAGGGVSQKKKKRGANPPPPGK